MNNNGDIERPVNNTTPSKITDYFPPSPKSKQTLETSEDPTSNGIYLYIGNAFLYSPYPLH